MQAPPERPSTNDRDLIVIPEAHPPVPQWVAFAIAGAAAIALIVGAVAMYASQRDDFRERDVAIAAITGRAVTAEDEAHTAAVRIGLLEARVADLRTVLDRSRARTVVVGANRAELRRQLVGARRELDRARARIAALAGTSTEDGQHIATIVAVGGRRIRQPSCSTWAGGSRASVRGGPPSPTACSTPAMSAARSVPARRDARLAHRAARSGRPGHRPRLAPARRRHLDLGRRTPAADAL